MCGLTGFIEYSTRTEITLILSNMSLSVKNIGVLRPIMVVNYGQLNEFQKLGCTTPGLSIIDLSQLDIQPCLMKAVKIFYYF